MVSWIEWAIDHLDQIQLDLNNTAVLSAADRTAPSENYDSDANGKNITARPIDYHNKTVNSIARADLHTLA